ncbi:hypothetical protein DFJ43DRAFT_1165557 [Lentinula guzmanii]|uniref:Cytidyltransferase-like domain-containing protein n=1 Tax=Lentinula guzmanii TaxID=2804957 RepID=A0AA38MQN7_9AGAR|nr:hypothetical protein DFJ43DRAFT_1165557 [Lentinula guzmanii]
MMFLATRSIDRNFEYPRSLNELLRRGLSVRYLLPSSVVDYIEKNNLYLDEAAAAEKQKGKRAATEGVMRISYSYASLSRVERNLQKGMYGIGLLQTLPENSEISVELKIPRNPTKAQRTGSESFAVVHTYESLNYVQVTAANLTQNEHERIMYEGV